MKILYCKASVKRQKQFQIYTRILSDDKIKYIEKESVYPQGKSHIVRMASNYRVLKSLYKSCIVCPCELSDNIVCFPFLEGETLLNRIYDAVSKENFIDELKKLLQLWVLYIKINDDNITTFQYTPEFLHVYGDIDGLLGVPALKVTNLDLNFDNIIFSDQGVTIFDYEWVYEYPLPLDYVVYRLLLDLYMRNRALSSKVSLNKLLDICGVNLERSLLDKMVVRFYEHISCEPATQVNMAVLGMQHTAAQIKSKKSSFISKIYYDNENGFSESNVDTLISKSQSFSWSKKIDSSIHNIRFDPVEDYNCIVQNLKVFVNHYEISAFQHNGDMHDNSIFFSNKDPQIIIELPASQNENYLIEILADVIVIEDDMWKIVNEIPLCARKSEKLDQKYKTLENHFENTSIRYQQEISIYQQELQNLKQTHEAVMRSTSWRMTKPVRFLGSIIKKILKSNRAGRLIFKGISCLKNYGFVYTCKKILRVKMSAQTANSIKKDNYTISEAIRKQQTEHDFNKKIKISILVPLYNTPEQFLKEMIDSVKNQTYTDWELCLADGSDENHHYVKDICLKAAKKEKRIVYKELDQNLGISENTNQCIRMSTGDFLGLLDHDDILHPSALYEAMKAICEEDADFIYTDENTFAETPKDAYCPNFKPDFAPDMLRSQNYICHFTVFNRKLLEKAGLYRSQCDGSQDYDMVLRLTEVAKNIVHIPKILYFWRASSSSVASNLDAKSYAIDAAKTALNDHLARLGLEAEVEDSRVPSTYRIRYRIKGSPLISIIIANSDHVEDLRNCIESITSMSSYKNYEIIIIENNSVEKETFDYYECLRSQFENIRIVTWEDSFNYAAINNYGISYVNGEYVLLLNNDVKIITPDWIQEMLMFAQREDVGAVGAMLYYPDDTIQHAGVIVGLGGVAGHSHKNFNRGHVGFMYRASIVQNLSAVTAACMMIPTHIYKEMGGFDERYVVAFNDVDFCMRIRKAGYLIVFTPYAELYHYESKSRGYEDTPEKQERFEREVLLFQKTWEKELLTGDPYYNSNLTLDAEDFSQRII